MYCSNLQCITYLRLSNGQTILMTIKCVLNLDLLGYIFTESSRGDLESINLVLCSVEAFLLNTQPQSL